MFLIVSQVSFALLVVLLVTTSAHAQNPTPVGVWLHENQRIKVEIAPCGDELCGKLVWFKRPNDAQGLPLVDVLNPDPALRTRPLLGLEILSGFRPAGDGTWDGGTIYNPDDGETYSALMSIQDDGSVRVRVYVFLSLFGETKIWTRAE